MKFTRIKCDRCGAEFNLNKDDDEKIYFAIDGYLVVKTKSDLHEPWQCLDFCDKCKEQFRQWMGGNTDLCMCVNQIKEQI